ncbi:MAG: TSUP family transporter, partial [Pseudomonadota bacterium]
WLLVFATVVFALGPRLLAMRGAAAGAPHPAGRYLGLLGVAVYGGYFNGGLGILLMALYTITGERQINTANALKNLNSLVLSLLSVAAFALAGAIRWPQALVMMAAATLGGFAGARVARRLPARAVRALVVATGVVMAAVFFSRA